MEVPAKWLGSLGVAFVAALAISLGCPRAAEAATIHVPADQPTIQQAITAASNGDTIIVSPGTYHENINFLGKAIVVKSSAGPSATTIDGGGIGPVVTFETGEANDSVLEGFTITNGNNPFTGGGVAIDASSPTIKDNVITQNAACSGIGIGLYESANAVIKDNLITQNTVATCTPVQGGGIYIDGGGVVQITGNTISKNNSGSGGAIYLDDAGAPTIENNVITGNTATSQGGGIATSNQTQGAIAQNLITANTTGLPNNNQSGQGGGIALSVPNGSNGSMSVNNTIAENLAYQGSGIYASGFDAQTLFYNNLIVGSTGQSAVYCDGTYGDTPQDLYSNDAVSPSGTGFDGVCTGSAGTNGNISADPLFLNEPSNLHLQNGSPAVDTGDNSAPDLPSADFDGSPRIANGAIDIGAYELQPTTVLLNPASLSFAAQALGSPSPAQPVTLADTGNSILRLAISLSPNFTETDNCGAALAAGASCTINVSFDPTTSGPLSGTLSLADNAAGNPQTVSLSGAPDFSIAVSSGTSSSATVSPGGKAGYSLTVGPEAGFNHTVSLACSGAPSQAACTVSPSSVTLDGTNSQQVNVTVATTAASLILPPVPVRPVPGGGKLWLLCLGLAALFGLGFSLRAPADEWDARSPDVKLGVQARLRSALLFAVLCGMGALAACGGGGGSGSTAPAGSQGTTAGAYTLIVTGTSGSLSHSTTLKLTVN